MFPRLNGIGIGPDRREESPGWQPRERDGPRLGCLADDAVREHARLGGLAHVVEHHLRLPGARVLQRYGEHVAQGVHPARMPECRIDVDRPDDAVLQRGFRSPEHVRAPSSIAEP